MLHSLVTTNLPLPVYRMITYGHGTAATKVGSIIPQSLSHLSLSARRFRFPHNQRTRIAASSLHAPDDPIIIGCGGASLDYLVTVDSFPKPDEKIRTTSFKVQGGGNVGNALTCAARLGLKPRIITKVASDSEGRRLVEELESDGVDTSFVVVSADGRSMFSYVIVDCEMKTRTAIYQPGYPPMVPDDISDSSVSAALDGAKLVYFDGLSLETALAVAMEAWTHAPSMPSALISMLLRLPNLKFVIVTLGVDGCIMLERSQIADSASEAVDVDQCFKSLKKSTRGSKTNPTCASSSVLKLIADGVGELNGRLFVGTAESIPPSELVDTTGAGDAFIGAVLYALCAGMLPEKMLPFACQVAASCCRALGARTGLPRSTDEKLESFFHQR